MPSASISTVYSSVLGTRQDVEVIQRFSHGRDQRLEKAVFMSVVAWLAVETE